MKTKSKLLIAVSIVAALCIGFFIGISVNSGAKANKSDVSGTMGKSKACTTAQSNSKSCTPCH